MYDKSQENHVEQKDKSLFGVYLNQARLNAYITLCHISELLGVKTVDEDSISIMPVLEFLENEKDAIKSQSVFRLIEKHFPMLKIIYDWQKEKGKVDDLKEHSEKYKKILTCMLKALNDKRNEYCHAKTEEVKKKYDVNELIRYLDGCFDASVRRIKENHRLAENEVTHLRRFTEGKDENGRPLYNPDFHYQFKDENGELNEKGLYFLTAIFLEKRDAHEFLKKQKYFMNDSKPKYRATLESFYCFRIKLPKPVMESNVDKNGLALDMLNELKKCPKELFELISKEQRKDFRVMDSEDSDEDSNEALMRRYSDRFPYFALRYCDENQVFDNLRFQIDLGRYYFKFYEKETIDGNKYPRALDKRLKTFGRIREVKEKVEKEWNDIIKAPDEIVEGQEEPYKQKSIPHYNIVDNQIGFVLLENGKEKQLPDIKQADGKIELQKPDAWLSIYELPGVIFHGLNYELNNKFKKTESLIEQYIKKQREICEEVYKTGKIPQKAGEFLPEALKDIEKSNTENYSRKKLDRMLKDTDQRIKAIKKTKERAADKSNKPGKKMFIDIKAGKLADFLARDIMAMQKFDPDKKGKDKLTSINFQVLQATLAYYGAKKDTIGDMFKRIGLIDGDNPHPFLNQINPAKYNSIADFYITYLDSKEQYLKNCKKDGDFENYQFLRPSRQHYAGKRELKTIAKQLLDNPVNIPKGFFEKEIEKFILAQNPSAKKEKMNTAYMIQAWFEINCGGQQPFYSYGRTYPVVLKAAEYRKKRQNTKIDKTLRLITPKLNYMDIKKIVTEMPEGKYEPENLKKNLYEGYKDFEKNERILRRYKVQDMVTFMTVEKRLKDQLSIKGNPLRLEAVTPKGKSLFKKPIPCNTDVSVSFNTNVKHETGYVNYIREKYDGSYICPGKKIILKYRVISENAKLKDIGKYRRYFYDRRLPGLLIWKYRPNTSDGTEIKYADIEEEIKAYEKHRKEIAQQMYMLEKGVIDQFSLEIEPGENYIPFEKIIETIKANLVGFDEKCETVRKIRNAVYHNQFPVREEAIHSAQGEEIAEKMRSVTESYVEQIMTNIESNVKGFENVASSC